ncbi:MAG: DUF1501 domain-containing protein [Pirellulaceae bacterium]
MTNRRQFIQAAFGGTALVSLSTGVPQVLLGASARAALEPGEKILVVIQLSGGNDGLNTVIPFGDDEYYKNRFTLAIGRGQVSRIDDHIGLHPALNGFAEMLDAGQLSIVQGVGYPNPNRSHFESMDLWHTAHRVEEQIRLGWLGRCVDGQHLAGELPAIHYGEGRQPLALATREKPVASITSLDQFRLRTGGDRRLSQSILQDIDRPRNRDNQLLGFIHDSASVALRTSQRIENVIDNRGNNSNYPATRLGGKLQAVSQLIESGLQTRIYYVTHEGFDTHSNQLEAHAGLLQELGDATAAFMRDLNDKGHGDRTAVMTFSEFGRRVRENASRGTDHGTAAPLFVAGNKVKAGALNDHPSLTDLDQGDLKFTTDYRRVYATVLESWLGIDSQPILGGKFEQVDLFA